LRAVVLEGGKEVGGLCILRGCMPSKALLQAADVLHTARAGAAWGLRIPKAGFDFKAVMARKNSLIGGFARFRQKELAGGKFKFLRANALFLDPHTLQLSPIHGRGAKTVPARLTAQHFIIATGSSIAPPPTPKLAEVGYLTSDDALSLRRPPRSLIVLGGGPIAVEMAQFFRRLDVEVTIIQRSPCLLRYFDIDAAQALARVLRREGVKLFSDTKIIDAFRDGARKGIAFVHQKRAKRVAAEEILLATGRVPNTARLGLEKIGVALDYGRIVTNAEMQTSQTHIYAAGDCTGPYQIVHIGIEQGEIAAHNIAHPSQLRHIDYRLLTSIAFTSPQVSVVGLTEKAAAERSIPFFTASHPFNDHGKSLIMEARDGFVKLLANPVTGEILGGACVGPMGGELLHEIIAAMHKQMTVHELAAMPHYHPTLSEIWTYPAAELAERIPQTP
jgi:pyruvate/2-oxoglutarate dehydrogenase complex dihydrolipoamide dehydrogenase (E3) component